MTTRGHTARSSSPRMAMSVDDDHGVQIHHRGPVAMAPAGGPAGGGGRRKGGGSKTWLVVEAGGETRLEEVGKHSLMRRTGLPARDLRVLDPMLSYPSTILGRERAIVINLEHIKAVITATEVLVPNSKDPVVAPFVHDLQARVSASYAGSATPQAMESDGEAAAKAASAAQSGLVLRRRGSDKNSRSQDIGFMGEVLDNCSTPGLDLQKDGVAKMLPFEFRSLEVCLEFACRRLESETLTLEQQAYPALDELTSKISTLNLERVRQIKSRLVTMSGRVQKVRDELEHLLDDDMDMAEMYLTEKLVRRPADETSSKVELDDAFDMVEERVESLPDKTESGRSSTAGFEPNIEELEMLLEAYFVQIDGTLNKLSALREYVDDTEDYINIMLDEKQNQLLQMGVMLSTATLVLTAGVVVVGVFGMNINIDLYGAAYPKFWETTFGTVAGCFVLYILAIGWGKRSGLLQ